MLNYTLKFLQLSQKYFWKKRDSKAYDWQFYSGLTQSFEECILVPQMGDSITEGTLQKFLKFPGDKVQADEIVLIETDKVTLMRAPQFLVK